MKHLHHHLMLATALAAGLVVAAPLVISQVSAEESVTVPTNPGFNPGTGQINPGFTEQAPSQSAQIIKIPTPEEARAAFIMPGWKEPSLGQALTAPSQGAELPQDKNTNQASQNAAGGPPGIGPEANRPGGGPTAPGQPQPNPGGSTMGSAASSSSGSTVSPIAPGADRFHWPDRADEVLQAQRDPRSRADHGVADVAERSGAPADLSGSDGG